MKRNHRRAWLLFALINLLVVALAGLIFVPQRLQAIRDAQAEIARLERHLRAMETNLLQHEANQALLDALRHEMETYAVITPVGQTGALLTEVRQLLPAFYLNEQDFFAHEHGLHELYGHRVVEIRAALSAEGYYDNITAFLYAMATHNRYFRLTHIQIAAPQDNCLFTGPARLLLNFSVYGH